MTPIHLEEGFHKGLDILFPPEDDNWWKGDFTYLDFKEVFNEIAKIAPITMADESFEENKWIIESSNQNKPVQWNESEFTFFSECFMEYLEKKGKDPRIVPSDYFIWYCSVMEGEDDSDIKEGVLDELEVVLGDNYDEKYLKGVKEKKWNVEFFIKLLTQKETSSHRNRTNALGNGKLNSFLNPKLLALYLNTKTFQPTFKLTTTAIPAFLKVWNKFFKITANPIAVWNYQKP